MKCHGLLSRALLAGALVFASKALAIEISLENIENFYQLPATKYACHYDRSQGHGIIGKINSKSLLEASSFNPIRNLRAERRKLQKQSKKVSREIKSADKDGRATKSETRRRERLSRNRRRILSILKQLKDNNFPRECAAFLPGLPPVLATVELGRGAACRGKSLSLPVVVKGLQRPVAGIDITIRFDPSRLELREASPGRNTSGWGIAFNAASPGELRAAIYGSNDLKKDGQVLLLQFEAAGEAKTGKTGVSLAQADFDEQSRQELKDGSVRIRRCSLKKGN